MTDSIIFMRQIDSEFFTRDAITVAKELLGMQLTIHDKTLIITQTESYLDEQDKASHARFGRSKRSSILYLQGGIIYVYLIYGIYYMLNIVTGPIDFPSAVLIREGKTKEGQIIKGPGNVAKYFQLSKEDNGKAIAQSEGILLQPYIKTHASQIHAGKRIGVDYAGEWKDKLYRFWIDI